MARTPHTTAHVRITHHSWQEGEIAGEIQANEWAWRFCWSFRAGELVVEPSLGRALIREPLCRFLEKWDYQLEPGSNYSFVIRSRL